MSVLKYASQRKIDIPIGGLQKCTFKASVASRTKAFPLDKGG